MQHVIFDPPVSPVSAQHPVHVLAMNQYQHSSSHLAMLCSANLKHANHVSNLPLQQIGLFQHTCCIVQLQGSIQNYTEHLELLHQYSTALKTFKRPSI